MSDAPIRRAPDGGRVRRRAPRGILRPCASAALAAVLACPVASALAQDAPPTSAGPSAAAPAGGDPRDGAPPSEARGEDALEEQAARADTTSRATLKIVPESVEVREPTAAWLRRDACRARALDRAPDFFGDTDLRVRLRSFVFDRRNPDESDDEAWALGGWVQYASGWAADVFSVGATLYTSQPLWAPEESDGTSILAPGQEPITVLGQAWARLRYRDHALLTAYRQSIDEGYLNPQDNRMLPNTFEGVTVRGKVGRFAYDVGYVWGIKPRNRDEFLSMSEQAGSDGPDEGLWFAALTWTPAEALEVYVAEYHLPELFDTLFLRGKYTRTLCRGLEGRFGLQGTDQRSVGEERVGDFATWNLGAAAAVEWPWGLALGAAVHVTSEDASIRSPFGTWPGWLSMIEVDGDRAGELAVGASVTWDFGAGPGRLRVPGFTAKAAFVQGVDRVDPSTGEGLPTTREYDLDLIYRVPAVPGLQVRMRNAWLDEGGPEVGFQVRFIVNYEIELL